MYYLRRTSIALPTMVVSASRSSFRQLSPFRMLFSCKNMSDWELQESFKGFLPKLIWTLQILNTDAGLESYLALKKKGTLGPSPVSFYVFALLQNPLLAKYGFDPADFIIGARSAFQRYSLASSSVEMFDFANGRLKTSEAAKLVRQSVWKFMYNTNILVLKKLDEGPIRIVETLDISDVQIYFARTTVIDNDHSDEDSLVSEWDIKSFSDLKSSEFKKCFFSYPIGSVVATVGLKFIATDKYREHVCGTLRNRMKANCAPDEWKRYNTELYTRIHYKQCVFEGCISGHVPLDWKIACYDIIGLE